MISVDEAKAASPEAAQEMLYQIASVLPILMARAAQKGTASGALVGRLLGIKETAERMNCSVDWLYKNGRTLPFYRRVGKSHGYYEPGLEEWLRKKRV